MTSVSQRQEIVAMVDQAVADGATRERACEVVGLSASTLRRWRPVDDTVIEDGRPLADRPPPANRYSQTERDTIVEFCNRPEYASLPPSQIVPILADEKTFIGSESTIYRALKQAGLLNHRGRAKARTARAAPTTHEADAPNQVWMMDVTWLPTRVSGQFYYLYMVEDLYSRFGVYWEVFETENSDNTIKVIETSMWREKCLLSPPVLHHDNGSPLVSHTVQSKVLSMGITPSRSRPRVSNDNAYIESFFRTLKYCPMWPSQGFANLTEAREWVQKFMEWYNEQHKHSALKFVTPGQRHRGEDIALLEQRDEFYRQLKSQRPDRWRNQTRNWEHQRTMTLNPEKQREKSSDDLSAVNANSSG